MKQQPLAMWNTATGRGSQKREEFLETMNEVIPREEWVGLIRPFYYEGRRGRPHRVIGRMLWIYLLQGWFDLSDEGVEDAIYDIYAMRKFVGVSFMEENTPDAAALLKFRRILENSGLGKAMFEGIVKALEGAEQLMRGGSVVDATIISALSLTWNENKARDPEMKQTMEGKEWKFDMKIHIGVDAGSGYVTAVEGTGANVHDAAIAWKLLRADDEVLYGDSGCLGLEKREEILNDPNHSKIECRVNRCPGKACRQYASNGKVWGKAIEGRVSVSIHEGAVRLPEDRIQRNFEESESHVYASCQFKPLRLHQNRTKSGAIDGIGLPK